MLPPAEGDDVVVGVELVEQLLATTVVDPGILLARRSCRTARRCRNRRSCPCRRSSTSRCGRLHGALLHGIQGLQAGNDHRPGRRGCRTCRRSFHAGGWPAVRRRRRWCPGSSGKLEVRRHLMFGSSAAMAGAARWLRRRQRHRWKSFFQKITTLHIVSSVVWESEGGHRQRLLAGIVFFTKRMPGLASFQTAENPANRQDSFAGDGHPVDLRIKGWNRSAWCRAPARRCRPPRCRGTWRRLPAMVISSTGWTISTSTQ